MGRNAEKWNKKKELACVALLTEPTMQQAADKVGIGMSTLSRWRQMEAFEERLKEIKREAVSHATTQLRNSMTIAVDTLVDICQNSRSDMARANAAKTLLDSAMKAHETEDLQERIEALESLNEEDKSA